MFFNSCPRLKSNSAFIYIHVNQQWLNLFVLSFSGKETTSAVPSKTEETAVTEERIAHILHEASAALRAQQVDVESGSEDSKPPSQAQVDFSCITCFPTFIHG